MRLIFDTPVSLAIALGLLVFLAWISRRYPREFILTLPLGAPGGPPFRPPLDLNFFVKVLKFSETAAIVLLISALGSPRLVSSQTVWFNRGADILFILDTSPSMAARDMSGRSRFDAARELMGDFARRRPSDALGIVALGEEAALLIPPTVDRNAFFTRLEEIQIGEMGDGTALGLGLGIGSLHLRNSQAQKKAAVLITDGENNAGGVHPETAAASLPPGVGLYVIGVGSFGSVPIDYVDPVTKLRRTGTLESRFNPEALKAIAKAGGGVYMAAPTAETLSGAFEQLDSSEAVVRRPGTLRKSDPIHIPLITVGFGLLMVVRLLRRFVLGGLL